MSGTEQDTQRGLFKNGAKRVENAQHLERCPGWACGHLPHPKVTTPKTLLTFKGAPAVKDSTRNELEHPTATTRRLKRIAEQILTQTKEHGSTLHVHGSTADTPQPLNTRNV